MHATLRVLMEQRDQAAAQQKEAAAAAAGYQRLIDNFLGMCRTKFNLAEDAVFDDGKLVFHAKRPKRPKGK